MSACTPVGARVILCGAPKNRLQYNNTIAIIDSEVDHSWVQISSPFGSCSWRSQHWIRIKDNLDFTSYEIPEQKPSQIKKLSSAMAKLEMLEESDAKEDLEKKGVKGGKGDMNEDNSDYKDFDSETSETSEDSHNSLDDYFDCGLKEAIQTFMDELFFEHNVNTLYVPGGSYNSVVHIMLENSKNKHRFVLRMPKSPLSQIRFQNISAIHELLASKTNFTFDTPKVILADATDKNPLRRQFWLQSYVSGVSLSSELSMDRQYLARCVARMMAEMFSVTFKACGPLVAPVRMESAVIGNVEIVSSKHPRVEDLGEGAVLRATYSTPCSDIRSFFAKRFSAMEKCRNDLSCQFFLKLTFLILCENKVLDSTSNCLVHTDFFARNVLYEKSSQQFGVVDWDDCEVLPVALAYFMPGWLWEQDHPEHSRSAKSRCFGYDPDYRPATNTDRKVKQAFVDTIEAKIPGYVNVVRQSRKSGLVVLGGLARFGTALTEPGHSFLVEGMNLLTRYGLHSKLERAYREKFSGAVPSADH